jgi:hypothetical protein
MSRSPKALLTATLDGCNRRSPFRYVQSAPPVARIRNPKSTMCPPKRRGEYGIDSHAAPRFTARMTGFFYLVYVVLAGLAGVARRGIIIVSDATATATNILAHQSLYQVGFACDLLSVVAYVVVCAALPVAETGEQHCLDARCVLRLCGMHHHGALDQRLSAGTFRYANSMNALAPLAAIVSSRVTRVLLAGPGGDAGDTWRRVGGFHNQHDRDHDGDSANGSRDASGRFHSATTLA